MAKKKFYSEKRDAFGRMGGNANMPQDVIMRNYPEVGYDSFTLDDTIKGVDTQMRDDLKKRNKKGQYPEKY